MPRCWGKFSTRGWTIRERYIESGNAVGNPMEAIVLAVLWSGVYLEERIIEGGWALCALSGTISTTSWYTCQMINARHYAAFIASVVLYYRWSRACLTYSTSSLLAQLFVKFWWPDLPPLNGLISLLNPAQWRNAFSPYEGKIQTWDSL